MEGWIRRWLGHGTSMDGWCTCLVWRAAVDGTLAELVRAAASHAFSAGGAIDISLY